MKDKSLFIITLALLMLAFIASSMGTNPSVAGAIIYQNLETKTEECDQDLILLKGKYIIPCNEEHLNWQEKIVSHSLE